MADLTHLQLQKQAAKRLYGMGYHIVALELRGGYRGIFDVIGMKTRFDVRILEVKANRNDFLSDNKWHKYLPYCTRFGFCAPTDVVWNRKEIPKPAGYLEYKTKEPWKHDHGLHWTKGCPEHDKCETGEGYKNRVSIDRYADLLEAILKGRGTQYVPETYREQWVSGRAVPWANNGKVEVSE